MSRRFVALGLPDEVRAGLRAALREWGVGFDGLRLTDPDGWHLTLAFLGELPDDRLPDVVDAVTGALATTGVPATLELRGAGTFGDSVLWCGIAEDPHGVLSRCADGVRRGCVQRGVHVAPRPLHPHVTMARRRAGRRITEADATLLGALVEEVGGHRRWAPSGVSVMRSTLGDGPARYEEDVFVPVPPAAGRSSGDAS